MKSPKQNIEPNDPYLHHFGKDQLLPASPDSLQLVAHGEVHPIASLASQELQQYLKTQQEWEHNFGLSEGQDGTVIGKMFGVLVVQDASGQLAYLCAFSGKLAGGNHHKGFVPPVFDLLTEGSFLNLGMQQLTRLNEEIRTLEASEDPNKELLQKLKDGRREHSHALQKDIFEHYYFLNSAGEEKSLYSIFHEARNGRPPAGAGECAVPKLLQHAFKNQYKPLAAAEFWWGQSPKSVNWVHGEYYECCKEKCEPILGWMLGK